MQGPLRQVSSQLQTTMQLPGSAALSQLLGYSTISSSASIPSRSFGNGKLEASSFLQNNSSELIADSINQGRRHESKGSNSTQQQPQLQSKSSSNLLSTHSLSDKRKSPLSLPPSSYLPRHDLGIAQSSSPSPNHSCFQQIQLTFAQQLRIEKEKKQGIDQQYQPHLKSKDNQIQLPSSINSAKLSGSNGSGSVSGSGSASAKANSSSYSYYSNASSTITSNTNTATAQYTPFSCGDEEECLHARRPSTSSHSNGVLHLPPQSAASFLTTTSAIPASAFDDQRKYFTLQHAPSTGKQTAQYHPQENKIINGFESQELLREIPTYNHILDNRSTHGQAHPLKKRTFSNAVNPSLIDLTAGQTHKISSQQQPQAHQIAAAAAAAVAVAAAAQQHRREKSLENNNLSTNLSSGKLIDAKTIELAATNNSQVKKQGSSSAETTNLRAHNNFQVHPKLSAHSLEQQSQLPQTKIKQQQQQQQQSQPQQAVNAWLWPSVASQLESTYFLNESSSTCIQPKALPSYSDALGQSVQKEVSSAQTTGRKQSSENLRSLPQQLLMRDISAPSTSRSIASAIEPTSSRSTILSSSKRQFVQQTKDQHIQQMMSTEIAPATASSTIQTAAAAAKWYMHDSQCEGVTVSQQLPQSASSRHEQSEKSQCDLLSSNASNLTLVTASQQFDFPSIVKQQQLPSIKSNSNYLRSTLLNEFTDMIPSYFTQANKGFNPSNNTPQHQHETGIVQPFYSSLVDQLNNHSLDSSREIILDMQRHNELKASEDESPDQGIDLLLCDEEDILKVQADDAFEEQQKQNNYFPLEHFDSLPSYSTTVSANKPAGERAPQQNHNRVSSFVVDEAEYSAKTTAQIQRELDAFERDHVAHPIFGSENLEFLVERDSVYAADPHYLNDVKQPNLTSNMRATLLDWMMEVSEEFQLKRETYHISVNLVDRYLSLKHSIKKRHFQLVGVTSLYIAAKLDEISPPRIGEFVCSTNNGYTDQEINETELSILQTLKFMVNPPTLNMWGNWFMSQWDIFVASSSNDLALSFADSFDRLPQFKQPDEISYALFREFMQIIDLTILNVASLQAEPRQMLACVLYLVLGKAFSIFDEAFIVEEITQNSNWMDVGICHQQDGVLFEDLFDEFVSLSFGFPLEAIRTQIPGLAELFQLPIDSHVPSAATAHNESPFKGYYEDFLSFQTHAKDSLAFIQRRL